MAEEAINTKIMLALGKYTEKMNSVKLNESMAEKEAQEVIKGIMENRASYFKGKNVKYIYKVIKPYLTAYKTAKVWNWIAMEQIGEGKPDIDVFFKNKGIAGKLGKSHKEIGAIIESFPDANEIVKRF